MSMEHKGEGEEFTKTEIDPNTGTVERKEKKPANLNEEPENWREQK